MPVEIKRHRYPFFTGIAKVPLTVRNCEHGKETNQALQITAPIRPIGKEANWQSPRSRQKASPRGREPSR